MSTAKRQIIALKISIHQREFKKFKNNSHISTTSTGTHIYRSCRIQNRSWNNQRFSLSISMASDEVVKTGYESYRFISEEKKSY